ncbi:MAG: bifunctional diaminohydroxyphosphoribosylaminopyrimidine deaminase/5-amino-6-(5-phosphoribosylamino)uracil reductase RibD [Chloroflexi bacterium]|nr:bifunctional diaminohydroxyphosphoribosylaminopyrimidine deaminase/5-amino-6-(5-phosphoribosylamino)uracil reductase RibD [Chloroflexota bacterium]
MSTEYMRRAIELARSTLGTASPNPSVGAVIVKDGRVVGEGWTQPVGGPHAEVIALRQAGDAARGATIYTTLEPCCHFGRTPPCTTALLEAGIAEAHSAMLDPDGRGNGKGVEELRAAGVAVAVGECAEEAADALEGYLHRARTGLPFAVAKFAMSLDGKIATATGESRWVSGEAGRRRAHELRQTCDAIMAGAGTVVIDNPQLTARDADGAALERQPLRVVVDSTGRSPATSQVFHGLGSVLVATAGVDAETEAAYRAVGADVAHLPGADRRVDLHGLMCCLVERGVNSVLVEGGGVLLASMFRDGLVSKVEAIVAPMIIGGENARTPVEGEGFAHIGEALRLGRISVGRLGEDVHVVGYTPTSRGGVE